ncbi:hypothetical protein BP6252_08554 [Coleophoma cylindrospora]|uniref:NmrA-like domain-containing protein n=1 Tax=Coleophoma cylindrospora TaxID=1849047 RepID=A0A3D8R6T3_9HELO|nr:hypothetical protein BP6252_08554 [Coleophoma cylindrospora]
MASHKQTVLAIGGTGAQGVPVVKALTADAKYNVHVLTRTANSSAAQELAALPGVTIIEGNPYDEETLARVFQGIDLAFVNINGFAIGEKAEVYWGIRIYEIAHWAGVQHFVWASIPYVSKLGGFDPQFRTGHMDGKGKVAAFVSAQPTHPMKWSILTSCMYMEMLSELLAPRPSPADPDVFVFSAPLGHAAAPLIHLPDLGRYARWIFDHPAQSTGMNLDVATESITWADLAAAFTRVTGKKAIYADITLDQLFASGAFPDPDAKVGHSTDPADPTLQTYRQNFSGFWRSWKAGFVVKDYAVLDRILPDRVRSVEEWMRLVGYTGEPRSVLKDYRDAAMVAGTDQK